MKEEKVSEGLCSFGDLLIRSGSMKRDKWSVQQLVFIALMAALSAVLMFISFPLPLAPAFLKFDISELPALFAGLYFGPLSGFLVIFLKIVLKLLMQGTETAFIGELMNIIGSSAFVITSAVIYKRYRTKRGALISLIAASVFASVFAVLLNLWIAFPMYGKVYGIPMDEIIAMGTAAIPFIHNENTLMLYSILPFNLLKHGVTALITWLLYKRCGNLLRSWERKEVNEHGSF